MPVRRLLAVLSGTFLAMGVLYGPQPLLPLLSRTFRVSQAASASFITWSLLAMSFGPLCTGVLLQKYSPRKLIVACLLGLAVSELLIPLISHFDLLKGLRFVQGALISALLAATMTDLASFKVHLRQNLAFYVGSAVMGGLMGRLLAGFISEHLSWQFFFLMMGLACLVAGLNILRFEDPESGSVGGSFTPRRLLGALRDPYVVRLYAIVFLGFFAMTAFLNFVPFRIEELDDRLGESTISLFYLGFIVGFAVSSSAPRIADILGGAQRAIALGLGCLLAGISIAGAASVIWLFFAVLLITSGFFLQHATIAALLNAYAGDRAGDVNSLYVSFYYIGGTAGSYFPGLLYVSAGWTFFVLLLFIVASSAALLALGAKSPAHSSLMSPLDT